jgi:LytS/YehU family sensor histidine kinase
MAAGFLTSLLLRSIYKKTRIQDRGILGLSLLAVVFSLLGANLTVWLTDVLKIPTWGIENLKKNIAPAIYLRRFLWWVIPLLSWSALYVGFKFWQEWMFQKDKAERARALAETAQLHMLRYRMNPHFLFNTLNTIRALIAENKSSAKAMITELSEYLRYSLVSRNYENVPLKEEIESVCHYFNIQKMSYEYKLNFDFDVDPAAEEYPIISFLLHPLVENAVRFGLCTSPLPLQVLIRARLHQGGLQVEVINSGSWIKPEEEKKDPLIARGLDNVRRRLADAYPGKHHFEILERDGSVQARLSIDANIRRP